MIKYELLPQQLLHEGTITEENLFAPEPLDEATVLLTHEADYLHRLRTCSLSAAEVRRLGFPLSEELVWRELDILNGTLQCALFAMQYGVALNAAGGTHHAYADRGEGFCLLNDIAVAANALLHRGLAKKILVIDLDVHQGNGTAALFAEEPRVFTFSMHGEKNFPLHKEKSDLDLALPDGCTDQVYLSTLHDHLPQVLHSYRPDLVFYQSGVDILAGDKLGRLNISLEGCAARDRFVLESCRALGLPVAASMGGGYSPRIATIIEAHAQTFRLAKEIYF